MHSLATTLTSQPTFARRHRPIEAVLRKKKNLPVLPMPCCTLKLPTFDLDPRPPSQLALLDLDALLLAGGLAAPSAIVRTDLC